MVFPIDARNAIALGLPRRAATIGFGYKRVNRVLVEIGVNEIVATAQPARKGGNKP
jgi:hypothetical protein